MESEHVIPLATLDHEAFGIEEHLRACWVNVGGRIAWQENGRPAPNQVWFRLVTRAKMVITDIAVEPELE